MGFGFLALGYFMALAFTGGRANNSGSGVGGGFLAGFLGGISSTLVQGKELKDTLSKLFKDDDDDDNTPKKDKDDNTPKKDKDDDDDVDFGLDDEEDDSESVEVQRGKALAIMQKQVADAASADPKDSKKIVDTYNAMIGCMYDDTGELLSPEKIEENMEKLKKEDKDLFSDIQKAVLDSSKDASVLDAFKESTKEISYGEAKAAYEIAAAQHVENKKKEAAEELNKELERKKTAINNDTSLSDDEKTKEIDKLKTEYEKKIEDSDKKFNEIIKIHNDKANELKDAKPTSLKNDPEIQQQLKEYNDLKKKKEILGGDKGFDYVKNKYKNFDLAQFNKGDLTDPNLDKEKQDALDAYLKENDIDKNTLISVLAIQGAKDENERKKLQEAADKNIRKQHDKEWDKVKKDLAAKEQQVKKLVEKKKQAKATGSTPKEPDPKEPDPKNPKEPDPKQVIKTVSGFEPKEGDKEWYPEIDENGDVTGSFSVAVVKEKDDKGNEVLKYVMRDADGEEVEIDKSEFEEHKTKYNDFKEELNPEDEEKLDELLDPEHQESEDEKNSEEGKSAERDKDGKRVNPAKIWHKKKNKQNGKTSKNYYNKSGASCTPEEYHKKIENYKKYVQAHKKQQPKESITDFLSDRLIVEEFYPTDITQYLKTFFD